jgi:salicylate hydroxylase
VSGITVDVLVGADGIHSAVRGALFGDAEPDFAGLVAYRGLVPIERIPDPEMATTSSAWVGSAAHFVHYPVSRGRLLNFVGWTEHDSWNREDWTDRAAVSRALNAFADWHADVRQIISAADTCFIWALFDRKPLPRWSVNRTTLLGDACHPMYPFMGQGAAQAIEDGAVLAECLVAASAGEAPEALRRYEALRLPRVSLLQEMSRANQTLLHAPDGPAQMARDAEWAVADERFSEVMHWLYGFDAQKLELMDREAVQALLPRPR